MGFIKSIKRFDESYNVRLSTYSVPYILGEIKRYIRDDGTIKVSRSIKELGIKIKEIQRKYIMEKGKEIGIIEIAKELKTSKEEVAMAMESSNNIESLDESSYISQKDDNKVSLIEKISTGIDEEEIITNKLLIKQLIEELEKKEKEVIMLRFYKEETQTRVAKILGMSQVQVSRIEKKILNNMKAKLIAEKR